MEVKQIYELVNLATQEAIGESAVVNEDLSNLVDIGTSIFDADAVDGYVKSLVNHIGKVIFVNRPYSGGVPSVLMDSWEFGSILEKIQADLPEATENESWSLQDGASYDPNIFYKPSVSAKFYNKRVTFEIPMSFTERQVKQSFSSREQLNGFISMLYNAVDKAMTIKMDSLIMRTINDMIGETLYDEFPAGSYTGTGVKAINLLKLYNDRYDESLDAEDAITDPDFIRFASYTMGVTASRMSKMSTLFNIGGKERFTPADMLHVVLLADFANGAKAFLESDTFNEELVRLPNAETVPYWQGSGTEYDFDSITAINVKTASGNTITADGILGVMFDRDAVAVCNMDKRVTTSYNAKGEFYNNFYKFDCGAFADTQENFVVFFVA